MPGIRSFILVLAFGSLAYAQSGSPPSTQGQAGQGADTVRIRTELVQIDVVVKDQKGNLVRDLRREDFEVLEDGKPQPLTHFAAGTAKQPPAFLKPEPGSGVTKSGSPGAIAAPAVQGRHIVLTVDDFHLVAENLFAVKSALTQFIEKELAPDDQVAMTATSGALGLYQQFTSDRAVIKRAINRLSLQDRTSSHLGGVPYISAYQAELIEDGDPGALQIALEELKQRQGKASPRFDPMRRASNPTDPDEGLVRAKARNIVAENARYTVNALSAIESAIRGLRQLPGRKIMVLLSDGFFTKELRNVSAYDLRRITDAATRAGVVIYSIDARGLVAKPALGSAADPLSSTATRAPEARRRAVQGEIGAKQESLFVLAKDTGGLPFFNNNDLGAGLKRVLEDTESYYVLAYEPSNQARDGSFRKIEVRVASRPGISVQTRAGYFAPTETAVETVVKKNEKPAKKPAQEVPDAKISQYRAALTSLVPLRGIPLDLAVHFIHAPPAGSRALITARIDSSGLSFEAHAGASPPVLEIVGVILDESGKTVSNFSHNFELKGGAVAPGRVQQGALNYHNVVALEPGIYNVRLAVADGEMKQIGSASDWIEIPDLKQKPLTLSSILLTEEGRDLSDIYDALAATLGAAGAAAKPLQPVRRFKRGANLDFLLFAYNAQTNAQGTGGLSIRIKVLTGGAVIYTSPPNEMPLSAEQNEQGAPCVARLPLDYEPGVYDLQIEVTDQITKLTATRSITFSIE